MEIGDSAEGGGGPKRDPTRGGTGGTGGQGPGECDDEANMPAVGMSILLIWMFVLEKIGTLVLLFH